jgi:hypothetical protein
MIMKMKKVELADGRVSYEARKSAKLVAPLSAQTFTNSNGTEYKLATIDVDGIATTAQVYGGTYNHADAEFVVGRKYSAKASTVWDPTTQDAKLDENGELIILWTLSHLASAVVTTASMFGFVIEEQAEAEI